MKFFSSELGHNYKSYTFGYAKHAKIERGDSLAKVYEAGFLPYSGARGVDDVFYMARSARVPLKEFSLSSENRRIQRKFEGIFERKETPLQEFDANEEFMSFCLSYFKALHGEHVMPRERLALILKTPLPANIISYHVGGKPSAYVLEIESRGAGHYWYSFYEPAFVKKSLGLWLMLDCIKAAQKKKMKHYYVGTVYGAKALYKTNFRPLEWWNGETWNGDVKFLRELGRNDEKRIVSLTDEWKERQELF